ncbi:phage terminase small subunit P27 family [Caminicella sporogenes]|uniref:phage terminase small subunit P27 family n=1 Tax=Caminicella sporogenes TaxID=166485 RepID=UPI0025413E44|nr:phage terminase small subunit P27 family [Caminicella sporogenes]WIF95132.1 phage terminase small subunit P27 family [Caminicella sporogenes]
MKKIGRKSKSINQMLKEGKTHLTKAEIERRVQEEERLKQLPSDRIKPPTWLGKQAKKIFKDIVKQIEAIDLLANIDIYTLAVLADAIEKYITITQKLHAADLTVEYTNKAGATNEVENPLIRTQLKYVDVIKKYSTEFGLTPISRLKIVQNNVKNIDLDEEEFLSEFGDV